MYYSTLSTQYTLSIHIAWYYNEMHCSVVQCMWRLTIAIVVHWIGWEYTHKVHCRTFHWVHEGSQSVLWRYHGARVLCYVALQWVHVVSLNCKVVH